MPSMVMVRVVGFVEVAEESAADDGAEVAAGFAVAEGLEGLEVVEGVVDELMWRPFRSGRLQMGCSGARSERLYTIARLQFAALGCGGRDRGKVLRGKLPEARRIEHPT
jgi:hypothetical protein